MALVNLPHNPTGLRDGTDDQKGSVVLANDQAIAAQVNGNLDRTNVSPSAALPGTVLSNTAGERVPTDRIEDDAITGDKLKDDPSTGHAAAAVNLANHVKDGILNGLKLANNTVGSDKLRIEIHSVPLSTYVGPTMLAGSNNYGNVATINGYNRTQVLPLICWVSGTGISPFVTAWLIESTVATGFYIAVKNHNTTSEATSQYTFNMAYIVLAST